MTLQPQARFHCTSITCGLEFLALSGQRIRLTCPKCKAPANMTFAGGPPTREHIASLLEMLFRYISAEHLAQDAKMGVETVKLQSEKLPGWYFGIGRTVFLRQDGVEYLHHMNDTEREGILDHLLRICPAHAVICWRNRDWYRAQVDDAIEVILHR